ncbi:MAG: endonuclease/exonuclease/phosphatase family protein [Longimicrobiales bacterium]
MRWLLCFALSSLTACDRLESMVPAGESCRRTTLVNAPLLPERVAWTETTDTAEQRVLDLWCETVGPAVVIHAPASAYPGDVLVDSIAIVSWNTHVGGADIERFVRDLRAGRFTQGDSVHHFVLLLQEVYRAGDDLPERVRVAVPSRIAIDPPGSRPRRDIVQTAAALGLSLLYVPSMRNGAAPGLPREDRGNAILATLPLEDLRALDLPYEVQRRVAAIAEIDVDDADGEDWDLTLLSVHLDTRSRFARIHASAGAGRLRQASVLVNEMAEDEPITVGGDFNTWAPGFFERAIPFLRAALPDTPEPPPQPTYERRGIKGRLDYLFFRLPNDWQATYHRIDAQYGSDHYPLLGWIKTR